MPYGLTKATNYYNKLEAWKLWRSTQKEALAKGFTDQAIDLAPRTNDSWRRIDKATQALRQYMNDNPRNQGGLQASNPPRTGAK